jgi:hypothetical protein
MENQGLLQSMVIDCGLFIPLFILLSRVRLRTVVLLLFLLVLLRQLFGVVLRTAAVRRAVPLFVRLAVQVFVVGVVRVKILTKVGLTRVVVLLLPLVDRLALSSKSAVVAALASVVARDKMLLRPAILVFVKSTRDSGSVWRLVIERYAIVVTLVIVVAVQLFIGVRSI